MNVKARFTCHSMKKYTGTVWLNDGTGKFEKGFLYAYEFGAVTGEKDENKAFFASTPSGSLRLDSVRDDLFEPGDDYELTFSKVEK